MKVKVLVLRSAEPVETRPTFASETRSDVYVRVCLCRRTATQTRAGQNEGPQDQQRQQSLRLHYQQGGQTGLHWS